MSSAAFRVRVGDASGAILVNPKASPSQDEHMQTSGRAQGVYHWMKAHFRRGRGSANKGSS